MASFQVGETVVVRGTIKDENDALTTPATSTKITITDPTGTVVKDAQDVSFDAIGVWKYVYNSNASAAVGAYHARVKAIDGARTTIGDTEFFLTK